MTNSKRYKNENLDPQVKQLFTENKKLLKQMFSIEPEPIKLPIMPDIPEGVEANSGGEIRVHFKYREHDFFLHQQIEVDKDGFLHFLGGEFELRRHRRIYTSNFTAGEQPTFLAILVNPELKTLEEVELTTNDTDKVKELLGYEQMNRRTVNEDFDVIIDAQAFMKPEEAIKGRFMFEGYHFANNTLFVPIDEEYGLNVDNFKQYIKWL